jgi:hypothetical protein
MKRLYFFALIVTLAAAVPALAQSSTTFSGTGLQGLDYIGTPPSDALYVPAAGSTPALAQLYTANSGTDVADDSPAVFVLGPMGNLNSFSASYGLYSSSVPSGTSPYWNLGVGTGSNMVHIIAMGGSTLDGSSAIHAYNADYSAAIGTWGMTLSALDALSYNGGNIGDMTVDWAGVEIGNWDNGTSVVPASASFDSFTVTSGASVPDGGTTLLLLGLAVAGLAGLRRKLGV